MYASAEFERLAHLGDSWDLLPATLLPTWIRTARTETGNYATDNLLQVEGLSYLGLSMREAPRTLQRAQETAIDPAAAWESRLAAFAESAGLDPADRPVGENWIYLEFAGGEPIYETSDDGALGPYGAWTTLDERIVASALGMSLLEQATGAERLLSSDRALDRYVGLVLAEAMANKILALDEMQTAAETDGVLFVPHIQSVADDRSLVIEDAASVLFDRASLIWGLASFVQLAQTHTDAWSSGEPGLRAYLQARAGMLLSKELAAVGTLHVDAEEHLLEIDSADRLASTADLALLLCALEAARDLVTPQDAERIDDLSNVTATDLVSRQLNGRFLEPGVDRSLAFLGLETQVAGVRGLLAANALEADPNLVILAQEAFDVLNDQLWIDTVGNGLYAAYHFDGDLGYCYTPFEVGLTVGALRELALVSDLDREGEVLARLAGFLRSVVDDAALQLSNAIPFGAEIGVGTGAGTISALRYQAEEGLPAPVLQQRLCLEIPDDGAACAGRRARVDEPWYQTDISMYAAYVVQDRLPEVEDYADANLTAVILHATLGLGLDDLPTLPDEPIETLDTTGFDLVAVPFAAGSPRLAGPETLAWSEATFDARITASALGMTLLRESQELRQLLDRTGDPEAHLLTAHLAETASAKLQVLEDLIHEAPDGTRYIPSATAASADGWIVSEESATLFGQLSLAFGLAEIHDLLTDPRSPIILSDDKLRVESLLDLVLATMERVLLDPSLDVLVDRAEPAGDGWMRSEAVTTSLLGLAAASLEQVATTSSLPQSLRDRAMTLLATEISFLQESLWRSPGVYGGTWSSMLDDDEEACLVDTLLGQVGALRALLVGHALLDLDEIWIEEARRAIEARFWDGDLQLYRGIVDASAAWCVTPLEFGLTVAALDRAAQLTAATDIEAASQSQGRLRRHTDRILDVLWLQLPASGTLGVTGAGVRVDEEGSVAGTATDRFAPVFDREVCLRPPLGGDGTAWAELGDLVRYTITADNETDEPFANLLLQDTLPPETAYVSSDPSSSHSAGVVSWTFDRFEPGESRTWSLIAQIDDSATTDPLVNCARLTYTNLAGESQPPREACADVSLGSGTGTGGAGPETSDVSYRTDEAMRLAAILINLADLAALDWSAAPLAEALSAANLGLLLQASDLGIPRREAPGLVGDRERSLAEALTALAREAGFPFYPSTGPRILVPFESGTPVLVDGAGFVERSAIITPAALGQTLACEAAFLKNATEDRLTALLRSTVDFLAENQIAWLGSAMRSTEAGDLYLPHGTAANIEDDGVRLSVIDTGTTIYDQASLLLGLVHTVGLESLDVGTRQLSQELASATLARLATHEADGAWTPSLPAQEEVARWSDLAVAALACERASEVLVRDRGVALDLLDSMADAARSQDSTFDAIEEAGRITVLLVAGRALGEPSLSDQGIDAWRTLRTAAYDATLGRLVFSTSVRRGLAYTPEELAVAFEMLFEVALAFPGERSSALAAAADLVVWDTTPQGPSDATVQLTDPAGFWQDHLVAACSGIAPVFGQSFGRSPF